MLLDQGLLLAGRKAGNWDTLLVPIKAETRKGFAYQFSSRVHMPNPHEFMEYIKAKKARVASIKS